VASRLESYCIPTGLDQARVIVLDVADAGSRDIRDRKPRVVMFASLVVPECQKIVISKRSTETVDNSVEKTDRWSRRPSIFIEFKIFA
jgi:hypothetical protein